VRNTKTAVQSTACEELMNLHRPAEWKRLRSNGQVEENKKLKVLVLFLGALRPAAALQVAGAKHGSASMPKHLVVLQNGLYGSAINLVVLEQKLRLIGGSDVLVHRATSNEGARTRDGVAAGGRRLAEEVKLIAEKHPSLLKLSLVGNSLGGLYARYAATELLNKTSGMMAGLIPDALVTTGSPHLGVRSYLFLPLPSLLLQLGGLVAGQSADDLLLQDDAREPLLVRMCAENSMHRAALRAFRRRRLYANLIGDFMVPFGTAAIENGCWGAGIDDALHASTFLNRPDASFRDALVCSGKRDGVAVIFDNKELPDTAREESSTFEEKMWRGLSSVPWSKVAVAFHGTTTFPFAHNKLPALRREGWRRGFEWIEQAQEGEGVMEHVAQYILSGQSDV